MMWTEPEFRELLLRLREDGSDSMEVEVKRASGGTPELAETLCAFGNLPEGGTIVLGLDEATGFKATGVERPAEMAQAIASQARNRIDPPVGVAFEQFRVDEKQILVVDVHAAVSSRQERACVFALCGR